METDVVIRTVGLLAEHWIVTSSRSEFWTCQASLVVICETCCRRTSALSTESLDRALTSAWDTLEAPFLVLMGGSVGKGFS